MLSAPPPRSIELFVLAHRLRDSRAGGRIGRVVCEYEWYKKRNNFDIVRNYGSACAWNDKRSRVIPTPNMYENCTRVRVSIYGIGLCRRFKYRLRYRITAPPSQRVCYGQRPKTGSEHVTRVMSTLSIRTECNVIQTTCTTLANVTWMKYEVQVLIRSLTWPRPNDTY